MLLVDEEEDEESDNVGWKAQHAGTMHSMSERINVLRKRTSWQSTDVAVSIIWRPIGPL